MSVHSNSKGLISKVIFENPKNQYFIIGSEGGGGGRKKENYVFYEIDCVNNLDIFLFKRI